MNQPQFVITRVAPAGPYRLALTFADGYACEVDLHGVITKHPTLARLLDPQVFAQVAPDEWKRGVVFAGNDDLTLASDNLRARALEQEQRRQIPAPADDGLDAVAPDAP